MKRIIIPLAILMLSGKVLLAQTEPSETDRLWREIKTSPTDSGKIAAYLDLSAYYLFQRNTLDSYLDSAHKAIERGSQLAERNGDRNMIMAVSAMLGNYHVKRGSWILGSKLCKEAIEYFQSKKDYLSAANCFHRFGNSIDDSTRFYTEEKLVNFESALVLFRKLGLSFKVAETLQDIAFCKAKQHKFDAAETLLREAITIYRPLDKARMLETYDALAEITEYQSDQHKQLKYRLELIEQMEASGDTSEAAYYYSKLAITYANISMYEASLSSVLRAIEITKKTKEYDDFYGRLSMAVFDYIQLGKPQVALEFLLTMKNDVPPQDLAHWVDFHDMLGKCYAALNQPDKAEYHFLTMLKLFEKTQNTSLYETRQEQLIDFVHYNQVIGNFYVKRKEFQKATVYFKKILALPAGNVRPITLSKVHLMQFKVDSASRNFVPAISHYIRYKQLQDSLFNLAKSQQLQELNVKYETERQAKDLQLNQQNIISLTAQTKLQQAELARESLVRNILLVASVLLLAIAYFGYRFKQQHNLRLQARQAEINDQNAQLIDLLEVQKNLVAEKEWLLKELHHRVKNNLHTVISLLETQATFLSDDALAAIQNSQHRVYAMSLIHQKLYHFENSTQIKMEAYLPELLEYLQDSFDIGSRIVFKSNYDGVELDLNQAIHIGLIFNEAVTNAIKYAFPDKSTGTIEISMTRRLDGQVRLSISDNGVGLPLDWKSRINNTLGLKLMRGLSEDIDGHFNIEIENGTRVLVEFKALSVCALDVYEKAGHTA
jgi:two-component sensor histidine kinase